MAKALIVDDSKFMRRIIRAALEEGGHSVIDEAENGADGIAAYKKLKPDFVTMDITMGGKDGIRAVKEILESDPKAHIVVISALNEHTLRLSEPDINAAAYITKPFEKDELLAVVKKILAQ
jgi:two-component system chemotaxis response regulator CheY